MLEVLDDYLERVWTQARHRRTGLFVDGGIGSYDGNPTIDQAGLTQVYAFRAWWTRPLARHLLVRGRVPLT